MTRKLTVYLFNDDGLDPRTEVWPCGCVYLSKGANPDIADDLPTARSKGTMFNHVNSIGEAVRVELAKNGIEVRP